MSDARVLPRQPRQLPVSLGAGAPALTADLSGDGFSADLPATLPPGTDVHGTLCLEGHALPFVGVVAWAHPAGEQAGGPGRIGVRLLAAGEAVRAPRAAAPR